MSDYWLSEARKHQDATCWTVVSLSEKGRIALARFTNEKGALEYAAECAGKAVIVPPRGAEKRPYIEA